MAASKRMSPEELEEFLFEQEKAQDHEVVAEAQSEYERALKRLPDHEIPPPILRFNLGVTLCSSPEVDDKKVGINMLENLVAEIERTASHRRPNTNKSKNNNSSSSSSDEDSNQDVSVQEALFSIASAYYRLSDMSRARATCEKLIKMSPDHAKARALHLLILRDEAAKRKAREEKAMGVGVAVAGAAALLGMLFARR